MKAKLILAGILVLGLAMVSLADVVIETKSEMDMVGAGQINLDQVQYIKGDRSYDKSTTHIAGGMMAAMGGGKDQVNVQIVRLDKGVGWVLNPEGKSYTEFTFGDMKNTMAQQRERGKQNAPMDEYEWTTDISKDIGTEKIMDFKCKGIRAVSVGVKKDDPKDSVFITNEQWFCDNLPGGEEFTDFSDKLAELMGSGKGFLSQMSLNPMLAKYGDQFEEIANEFNSIEGVPLKTVLVVEGTVNPMEKAMGGKEMDDEAKAMMEKMGISVPGTTPEGGHHNLVSVTSTVTKIEKKPIEDSMYEIPEGYKKQ